MRFYRRDIHSEIFFCSLFYAPFLIWFRILYDFSIFKHSIAHLFNIIYEVDECSIFMLAAVLILQRRPFSPQFKCSIYVRSLLFFIIINGTKKNIKIIYKFIIAKKVIFKFSGARKKTKLTISSLYYEFRLGEYMNWEDRPFDDNSAIITSNGVNWKYPRKSYLKLFLTILKWILNIDMVPADGFE